MPMDFFRRPQLAGNNIVRPQRAVLRGKVRRKDADGSSTVPYFAGAVAGQTLNIELETGSYPVVITDPNVAGTGITTLLADINLALAGFGGAYDADGSIAIFTNATNSLGSVLVNASGTSNKFLGFDTSNGSLRTTHGDLPSSPEGRKGNWNGVAFPNLGENLKAESVNRAFARVSANADVLYSDVSKLKSIVRKLDFTTADNVLLTLTESLQQVFVGGFASSVFDGTTDKEHLSSFFQIIDNDTGQLALSRVVGLARGPVVGLPPYSDATAWTGLGSTGNVCGVSLDKATIAIDSIVEGRFIKTLLPFPSDVVSGDVVTISGATNNTEWNNNGRRWIVDRDEPGTDNTSLVASQLFDNKTLPVRPMSKAELAYYGTVPTEAQPVLELSSLKSGGQTYGSVTVSSGAFCTGVNIIVDPPLPVDNDYELWASVPVSTRGSDPYSDQFGSNPGYRNNVSDLDPTENGLLKPGEWSLYMSGPDALCSGGQYRLHGKVFNLPSRVFTPSEFVNGINYVFLVEATGNYGISNNPAFWAPVVDPVGTPSLKGHLIGIVFVAAGVITLVNNLGGVRVRGENAVSVTVGAGGQFASLPNACFWASTVAQFFGETAPGSALGAYPHFEFVLVSNLNVSGNYSSYFGNLPSVTVRGVTPSVCVNMMPGSSNSVFGINGGHLKVKDLQINPLNGTSTHVVSVGSSGIGQSIVLENVRSLDGSVELAYIVGTDSSSYLTDVRIQNCAFKCKGVIRGNVYGTSHLEIRNSEFTSAVSGSNHEIIRRESNALWTGKYVTVEGCQFLGAWKNIGGSGSPLVLLQTSGTARTVFRDCIFELFNHPSASNAGMFEFNAPDEVVLDNLKITVGKIPVAVSGGERTTVTNCSFQLNPEGLTVSVSAGVVANCLLEHVDTDGNVVGGVGISMQSPPVSATGNRVNGPFATGIECVGSNGSLVEGNTLSLYDLTNAVPVTGIDCSSGGTNGIRIIGNNVNILSSTTAVTGIRSCNGGTVTGNRIGISNPTVDGIISYGINASGFEGGEISSNLITTDGLQTAYVSNPVKGITICNSSKISVVGNSIALGGSATGTHHGIEIGDVSGPAINSTISNNSVTVYGNPLQCTNANRHNVIDGNTFIVTSPTGSSGRLYGIVSNNYFSYSGAAVGHSARIGYGTFTGNQFSTVELDIVESGTSITFTGNRIFGSTTLAFAANFAYVYLYSNIFSEDFSFPLTISGTLYDLHISGGRVGNSTISNTSGDISIQDSTFFTLAITNGGNSDSSTRMRGVTVDSTFSITSRDYRVSDCTFNMFGALTFSGQDTLNSAEATIDGCQFSGVSNLAISNTAKFRLLNSTIRGISTTLSGSGVTGVISNCLFTATPTITFPTLGTVSNCTFLGDAIISAKWVRQCQFDRLLTMSGFDPDMVLEGCNCSRSVSFTQDISYPKFHIANNTIIPGLYNAYALLFPVFTFSAGMGISILGNTIIIGATAGGFKTEADAIYFQGDCSGLTLSGNTIELYTNIGVSPTLGTRDFAILHVYGATGANNTRNQISGNRFKRPLNFSGGGYTVNYTFWRFEAGDVGSVIGAGNVLEINGLVSNSSPHNGSQFYLPGALTTPYTQS